MTKKAEQKQYDITVDWNSKYAVGQKVLIRKDGGDEFETITTSPAHMLCGTAVCFAKGIRAAYMLERFRAMEPCGICKEMLVEPWPYESPKGVPVCDECGQGLDMSEFIKAEKAETKYYLQDKRGYVGNDILWWQDGGGYTTSVVKAEVFTKEKAFKLHASRETDIPWPKEYIDQRTRLVIDMRYVDYEIAMQEG